MVDLVEISIFGRKEAPLKLFPNLKSFLIPQSLAGQIKHTSAGGSQVNMCPQLLAVLAGCDLVYLVTMLLESIRKFGLETRFFISSPMSYHSQTGLSPKALVLWILASDP